MKRAQFGPHDWLSLPVPPGPNWLLVDSLEPETAYQFSVLAQNKLGTSAFSEVVTVNTLGEAPGLGCPHWSPGGAGVGSGGEGPGLGYLSPTGLLEELGKVQWGGRWARCSP